ncbi:MAG: hypothetical protein KUL87_14610 [Pseudomonas sp.]|nr:hypothetical protein [Pseudomonas sp.]
MANIYVKAGAGNVSPFANWANAADTVVNGAGVDAAGDTIFVSQSHTETAAAVKQINLAGTLASPVFLLCANDGAEPPTALATTAVVATTGANRIDVIGTGYIYGMQFKAGSSSNNAPINLGSTAAGSEHQVYESCRFEMTNSGTSSFFNLCASNATATASVETINCDFVFGANTGQTIVPTQRAVIRGGTVSRATFTGSAFSPFGSSGEGSGVRIDGVDLTGLSTTFSVFNAPSASSNSGLAIIRNSKLPSGWTGDFVNGAPMSRAGCRAEMHNCVAGSTVYKLWVEDYGGSIRDESVIVRTGGADDGAAYSWKLASSANCAFPSSVLESPEIAKYNTSTSSITVTVEIVLDSSTALKDDEIWLEVSYPGASGQTVVSDAKASVLATAADQTSSSVDWTTTGLSTPLKQKLSVTFTPASAGWLQAKVKLAKPSTTVYVDPVLSVA